MSAAVAAAAAQLRPGRPCRPMRLTNTAGSKAAAGIVSCTVTIAAASLVDVRKKDRGAIGLHAALNGCEHPRHQRAQLTTCNALDRWV